MRREVFNGWSLFRTKSVGKRIPSKHTTRPSSYATSRRSLSAPRQQLVSPSSPFALRLEAHTIFVARNRSIPALCARRAPKRNRKPTLSRCDVQFVPKCCDTFSSLNGRCLQSIKRSIQCVSLCLKIQREFFSADSEHRREVLSQHCHAHFAAGGGPVVVARRLCLD
jgi:hypothetical protein